MNRTELATLLAQTHPSRPPPGLHSSGGIPESPTTVRTREPSAPLSPRQLFQSRVRTLSDDDHDISDAGSISPQRSNGLHHLSSLRVHVRSTTPANPCGRSPRTYGHPTRDGRFSFTTDDPDFVLEERAAWDAESQEKPGGAPCSAEALSDALPDEHHTRPFGRADNTNAVNERPKTRRGPESQDYCMPGTVLSARKSKFNEGSMSDRSTAISSTWAEHGPNLSDAHGAQEEDELDSDATPRAAARMSRDSYSSLDISDFQPPATTPATMRNKLTKLGSHLKLSSSNSNKPDNQEQKKDKRKGLRKSISNWNFHGLGEKMRLFGSSTHDLHEPPIIKDQEVETALLNDRKRKAEEAYAQQFGAKKQKANDGLSLQDKHATVKTPSQPGVLKQHSAQRVVTPTTVRRCRDGAPAGKSRAGLIEVASDGDVDRRKRPSRRELEKENQHLRVMLREKEQQQNASLVCSASKSTIHLPLTNDPNASSAFRTPGDTEPDPRHANAPGTVRKQQKQRQNRDIPPVPALPDRAVLAHLTGNPTGKGLNHGDARLSERANSDKHDSRVDMTGIRTVKRISNREPRVVSTIFEADENNSDLGSSYEGLESDTLPGLDCTSRRNEWQWPDDVF